MKQHDIIPDISGESDDAKFVAYAAERRALRNIPDIAFCGLYKWAQRGELDQQRLAAALKHTSSASPLHSLLQRLEVLRQTGYNEWVDGGWLNARHPEKARKQRLALMAEHLGEEATEDLLTDPRILVLFPPVPPGTKISTLPLSIGSAGFDRDLSFTLKHYLPENSLCSIYGRSGAYKSFLAVSWACHIAAGIPWAGHVVSPGSVLYVVGEGGIGVPRRIRAWELVHYDGNRLNNVWLVNRPVFPVDPNEVREVVKAVRQMESITGQQVRFIVIDTLARCFGGNDENDARDMGAFIEGCDILRRETGATLLVVHHSGKDDSKGARGSSAFRASLDAEFSINREGQGGAIILTCTKMKDAEEPPATAFDLHSVELFTDGDGDPVSSLVIHDVPREPNETVTELAAVSNLSENHIALWQCIRSRRARGQPCNMAIVRDDMVTLLGENGRKGFSRWINKLVQDGVIELEADNIVLIGHK